MNKLAYVLGYGLVKEAEGVLGSINKQLHTGDRQLALDAPLTDELDAQHTSALTRGGGYGLGIGGLIGGLGGLASHAITRDEDDDDLGGYLRKGLAGGALGGLAGAGLGAYTGHRAFEGSPEGRLRSGINKARGFVDDFGTQVGDNSRLLKLLMDKGMSDTYMKVDDKVDQLSDAAQEYRDQAEHALKRDPAFALPALGSAGAAGAALGAHSAGHARRRNLLGLLSAALGGTALYNRPKGGE